MQHINFRPATGNSQILEPFPGGLFTVRIENALAGPAAGHLSVSLQDDDEVDPHQDRPPDGQAQGRIHGLLRPHHREGRRSSSIPRGCRTDRELSE